MSMMGEGDVWSGTSFTNELFAYAGFKVSTKQNYDIDVSHIRGNWDDYEKAFGIEWNGVVRRIQSRKHQNRLSNQRRIGLACLSRDPRRCYPHRKYLKKLLKRYGAVYEFGKRQLSIEELRDTMSQLDILISTDNGLAHLGGHLGIPLVIIQGHTPCRELYGWYGDVRYVESDYRYCYNCYECSGNCLYLIHPRQIVDTAFNLNGIVIDAYTDNPKRGLGDIIMSTVLAKAFKSKHPELPITYVARKNAHCLLEGNSDIDDVTETLPKLEKKNYIKFGYAFESYSYLRNRRNRIDSMLLYAGISVDDKVPFVPSDKAYRQYHKSGKVNVGVGINSAADNRRWKPKYLDELAGFVGDRYLFHVLDMPFSSRNKNIVFYDVSLAELPNLVTQMDKMLCMDSMLSHLSGALGVPSVVLYTTIEASWRNKYYESIGIQAPIECSPCMDNQVGRKCLGRCMDTITPILVYENILHSPTKQL